MKPQTLLIAALFVACIILSVKLNNKQRKLDIIKEQEEVDELIAAVREERSLPYIEITGNEDTVDRNQDFSATITPINTENIVDYEVNPVFFCKGKQCKVKVASTGKSMTITYPASSYGAHSDSIKLPITIECEISDEARLVLRKDLTFWIR